jgi:hypothetical protein
MTANGWFQQKRVSVPILWRCWRDHDLDIEQLNVGAGTLPRGLQGGEW